MTVKIKVQKDYYLTEVSVDSSAPVSDVDALLKAMKTNGKMVVLYNGGAVQGINVEQRTKITDTKAAELRPILSIETTEMEVKIPPRK